MRTQDSRSDIQRLDLSAAVRYEHYSDFGATTNPKFGVEWQPVPWLTLRSSYGTSFKAPNLINLDNTHAIGATQSSALIVADPASPTGEAVALAIFGGNPALQEQTADSLSVGVEFRPTAQSNLRISYFNIDYRDRIATMPIDDTTLANERLYSQLITRARIRRPWQTS